MTSTVREPRQTSDPHDAVEAEIRALFSRSSGTAQAYGADFSRLWSLAGEHMQGGKLVRPRLLLDTYMALSQNTRGGWADTRSAVRVAAAVEALHYAFLLHDDVIDGDLYRRGRPNLIGELARTTADETRAGAVSHWAQAGGILAGSLLLSGAHQVFARIDAPAVERIRLLDLLDHTVFETTAGEFTDVGLSDGLVAPDLDTVLAMTRRKTASYSFELPLRAAAILAGAAPELEHALSAAGSHLGLAYQLQDDLLSTFGDAHEHGKDPYSDLREGKQTAIICFARLSGLWPYIAEDFGDPDLTLTSAERLRDRLRECGAEEFVSGLVQQQLAGFYDVLAATGTGAVPSAVREVLLALADRIEGRRS
ncbi:polyprenyl synthetase family protein [Microbacterium esteraromaticum]|uniref:polyprenyl synthetase family protein n=1 Tax=Microbacterium esteraromaticum TaxID=57043 RepID=UPI001C97055F|nr:polyprenyl synthetase family protein [Microbacterium esteraromaticum]MBY6061320.1 polyprenyl synthetase family protein [Microbacterium esteraromaticum]